MQQVPVWVKPAFWGVAMGAVGWWMILAFAFHWVSAGAAARMVTQKTQEAVVAYATPVCVARFEQQKNPVAAWNDLKKTEEWSRGDLIVKDGWIAEPNQKVDTETANAIADSCAARLMALQTLNGAKLGLK